MPEKHQGFAPSPTYLADDAGVVAVPPAAVEVEIGELVGEHAGLVLRDARQEGGQEFDLCVCLGCVYGGGLLSYYISTPQKRKAYLFIHSVQLPSFWFVCVFILPWGRPRRAAEGPPRRRPPRRPAIG